MSGRKLYISVLFSTAAKSKKSREKNRGNCYLSKRATGASHICFESAPPSSDKKSYRAQIP